MLGLDVVIYGLNFESVPDIELYGQDGVVMAGSGKWFDMER